VLWTNAPALRPYLWLLPLSLAAAGLYQVLNFWALRCKAFTSIAHTRLAQGMGTVASQVSIGLVTLGPLGLLVGDVVGRAAGRPGAGRGRRNPEAWNLCFLSS